MDNLELRDFYRRNIRIAFMDGRFRDLDVLIQQVISLELLVLFEFNQESHLGIERTFIVYLVEHGARYFNLNYHTYVAFNMEQGIMEEITEDIHWMYNI